MIYDYNASPAIRPDKTRKNRKETIMYLNKKAKEEIADAFSAYGTWSQTENLEKKESYLYAHKRCAQAVLVLVSYGIPHHLEDWAKSILQTACIMNADYKG